MKEEEGREEGEEPQGREGEEEDGQTGGVCSGTGDVTRGEM